MYIAQAKKHSNIKPGQETDKPANAPSPQL
jgi:hypothetical protein